MSGLSGPQNETIGSDNIEKVAGTTGLVGYANTYISLQAVDGIFINGIGSGNSAPSELPFSNEADANKYISGLTNGDFWISGQNGGAVIKSCDRSTPGPNGEGTGSIHINSANGDVVVNVPKGNFESNVAANVINTIQGNVTNKTTGNLNATTHGHVTMIVDGNLHNRTGGTQENINDGNLLNHVLGAQENINEGDLLNLVLGAQENINGGDLLNLVLGAQENINLIELLNLCLGFQQNINLGGVFNVTPTKNHDWEVETTHVGASLKDVGSKIETAGTHIKTAATSLIQSAGIHIFTS